MLYKNHRIQQGGGGGLLSRKIGGGVPPAAENWTLNGWAENGI